MPVIKLKKSMGVTLVELMLAIVISSILMLGIIEIFNINSRSYRVQGESARMQESGRYAFNTLMTDIRRAGYFGGNSNPDDVSGTLSRATPATDCLTSDSTWGRMIERPFYGLDDSNNNSATTAGTGDYTGCIPNTDYLRGDILVTRYTNSTPIDDVTAALEINDNRLYLRNSLFSGRLFQGSQLETGDAAEGTGNYIAETPNTIRELASNAYYVGPSGRNCQTRDANNNLIPIPALLRERLGDAGIPIQEEVASGIENIQFQYGIDNSGNGSVSQYYNADEIQNSTTTTPNWTQVKTVRLWVLVRSDCPTDGYTNTNTYDMGDLASGYTSNDGFKRQLYSTTVASRN